jgi:hypothetical protein
MTGSAQLLINGISVKFTATTGHTLSNSWTFTANLQTNNLHEWQNSSGTPLTVIDENGSVGIGTASPGALLDVSSGIATGSIKFGADVTALTRTNATRKIGRFTAPGYTTATDNFLVFGFDFTGATSHSIFFGGQSAASLYTINNIGFYTVPTDKTSNGVLRMYINGSGNVGIGTSTPTTNLQVAQITTGEGTVSNSAGGTTVSGTGTQFLNTFKVGDTITINLETVAISAIASNTSMTVAAITGANSNVAYTLTGGTRFSVLGNGNVGIGTTTPSASLQIKAGIASVGGSPLKFTSGTDLTTAETGAVEYDGTNLHFTPTGTLRENIHFGSKGSGTLTAGTTTTVTVGNAKTTSVIMIQPTSAAITLLGVYVSAKNNGTFVLTHTIAAGTESFDYLIIN